MGRRHWPCLTLKPGLSRAANLEPKHDHTQQQLTHMRRPGLPNPMPRAAMSIKLATRQTKKRLLGPLTHNQTLESSVLAGSPFADGQPCLQPCPHHVGNG